MNILTTIIGLVVYDAIGDEIQKGTRALSKALNDKINKRNEEREAK